MSHKLEVTDILSLTHNVKRFRTPKPDGFSFQPGQATEVAIDLPSWKGEKRPFTFTSLPTDDYLEFVVKSYRNHNGVTNELDSITEGTQFLIDDPWGAIHYKGRGTFIAGGAGITPFISILRDLKIKGMLDGHQLIFSNKKGEDVILEAELQEMLGEDFISTLTLEHIEGHEFGRINMEFLKKHVQDFSQHFYVCGPDQMVKDITQALGQLGASADSITFEE